MLSFLKILCITVALVPALVFAQQQAVPEPLIVDVHASPYRASITLSVDVGKQRLDMRNATIVNMIDFAHGRADDDGREDNAIAGGPTWIDLDRFDVAATIPSAPNGGSPNRGVARNDAYDRLRPVIERILEERFHLKYHTEDRPLPGYVMTVGKEGAKLAEAKDPTAPNKCQATQNKSNSAPLIVTCTSETMAQFLATFAGTFRYPIVDRTGLTKSYDFTLDFSAEPSQTREDYIRAYTNVLGKQLGIAIAPGSVPQPAIVVDTVDRTPTPNAPQISKLIPVLPDLEFEVATIKPAADDEPQRGIRLSGSQISFSSFTMQELLTRAWEFATGAMLGNRPEWLTQTRYTILMKLPAGVDARAVSQNSELFDEMLRKLLSDRFQMKYHWGEQTVPDAYVLLGGTPKMKKADPNSRSYCKYGPPEGEKDLRTTGSAFNGELHCQNVTMDQFADLLQAVAGSDIKYRVPNKTGLAGAYDFTLYYTSGRNMRAAAAAADAAAKQNGDATAAPVAGLSIEDAFRKELGLRLEKQPGSYPALILDHIEQVPTEN